MKQKILLLFAFLPFLTLNAQKKQKKATAFAITSVQKGQSAWTEVRLIDITTGEEVKSIYQSTREMPVLNARTGKPIAKKEIKAPEEEVRKVAEVKKIQEARKAGETRTVATYHFENGSGTKPAAAPGASTAQVHVRKVVINRSRVDESQPFATSSAACAYDPKHERLYYTPMGINQLRYIDLKSKTTKVYYFEDEAFGVLSHPRDVPNQITRMVVASDGNGYALTNNGEHLIRFTTGRKPVITDLGTLTDDPSNTLSIHNSRGYGGDMVADAQKNLYLVTANRNVFRIHIDSKVALYLGKIKGLPGDFTTNGAIVDEEGQVLVSSSQSTLGYYRFDLGDLQAKKVTSSATVFNASDLANGNLAFDRKKRDKAPEALPAAEPRPVESATTVSERTRASQVAGQIDIFPNPAAANSLVKLSFADQPPGKYSIQLLDITGKVISRQEVTINNKLQVEELRLPDVMTAGNYLVRVENASSRVSFTNKITVR